MNAGTGGNGNKIRLYVGRLFGEECVNLYEILGQKTMAYIDFENDHRSLRNLWCSQITK